MRCDVMIAFLDLLTLGGAVVLSDLGLEQRDDLGVLEVLGCIEGCYAIV